MRIAPALLLLAACAPQQPQPRPEVPHGAWLLPGSAWRLVELDGKPFAARMTATLTEDGRIAGQAPCNRFTADYVGRWPDLTFEIGSVTRMACPELAAETAVFATLGKVNHAALDAAGLRLSGPDGAAMRFERE